MSVELSNVVQNSDVLNRNTFPMVESVPYTEPNEYEKNMIKDTLTPEQLLQREEELKNKPKELTDEEKNHIKTRDYITKVDRKSTRLNSSHTDISRMPSSA